MTNEEAIKNLSLVKQIDDCISREMLLKMLNSEEENFREMVIQAPSVYPKPKTGHWTYTDRTNIYGGREIVCSECGESFMVSPQTQEHLYECERFCCRCGAKMEVEHED